MQQQVNVDDLPETPRQRGDGAWWLPHCAATVETLQPRAQSQPPLLVVRDLGRDAGGSPAVTVRFPSPRQEQPPLQRAGGGVGRGVDADRNLAVGAFAQDPAVLTLLAKSSACCGERFVGAMMGLSAAGTASYEVMTMSLRPHAPLPVPDLTAQVARAVFPGGCLGMRLRDTLGSVFRDDDFADLFPRRGQPAFSPGQLALVCVLQFVEGLSDRQAVTAVRDRIGWKYALGLELTDRGFDFSVLSEFRARLIAGKAERRVLDQLLELCRDHSLLGSGGAARTDSTHVLGAVRVLNRLELVGETVRAALNALAIAAPRWLGSWMPPVWADRYGHRVENYRLPQTETERLAYARQWGPMAR